MHEAGLARTFVAEVERRGLQHASLRLIVSPGHESQERFEVSFRAYVEALATWYRPESLDVVIEPAERICSFCVSGFRSAQEEPTCPVCGGPPLPATEGGLEFEVLNQQEGGPHVP